MNSTPAVNIASSPGEGSEAETSAPLVTQEAELSASPASETRTEQSESASTASTDPSESTSTMTNASTGVLSTSTATEISPPLVAPTPTYPGHWTRGAGRKIIVGVCAREKKAKSKAMNEILSRLDRKKFQVLIFGDQCILQQPPEQWPFCDALIAFYSTGFPLAKAEAYAELVKPYVLNDLSMQRALHDRRCVYDLLMENNIDVPVHAYLNRDEPGGGRLEEFDEFIVVNGMQVGRRRGRTEGGVGGHWSWRVTALEGRKSRTLTSWACPPPSLPPSRRPPDQQTPGGKAGGRRGPQRVHLLPALHGRRLQASVPQGRGGGGGGGGTDGRGREAGLASGLRIGWRVRM